LYYEQRKHDGSLPIVGVNTFENPHPPADVAIELARSTEQEKQSQIQRLEQFQQRHREVSAAALQRLQDVAIGGGNVFAELLETVRCCSLGQITQALFGVGGKYRRSM
jgi:methylmalonyl-CoA mutase